MFNDMQFCYLEGVFVDEQDVSQAYELILCDSTFTYFYKYLVKADELESFYRQNLDHLRFNFTFEDEYLKCAPVARNKINNIIQDSIGKPINRTVDLKVKNFFGFIQYALANNALFVNSDTDTHMLTEKDVTKFSNLHISRSTMSAYFKFVKDNTMKNEMIVTFNNGMLEINPFTIALPDNDSDDVDDKLAQYFSVMENVSINNKSYTLYRIDGLSFEGTEPELSYNLINKANVLSYKYQNLINIFSDFSDALYKALHTEKASDVAITWGGGTNSYESSYGIYFTSNLDLLTKAQRVTILNWLLNDVFVTSKTKEEALQRIREAEGSQISKLVAVSLTQACFGINKPVDAVSVALQGVEFYTSEKLACDLYLYQVRTYCYQNEISVAPNLLSPIIYGSDEGYCTVVKEGFKPCY